MWATFTPTKMSGQVLKIYKKTLKVCEPFEGLIATLNEKSQSATISIGSDTNDKSFFICIYFAFSHTCSTQVYPFLSLVWGYRAREGEKSSFFFVASKIE